MFFQIKAKENIFWDRFVLGALQKRCLARRACFEERNFLNCKAVGKRSLSFFPFFADAKEYSFSFLRFDLFAALAVALMTIPQSIAYSLLAGLPPMAGLYAAIFGTLCTALWGSSRVLISGPSTGIAILLQTALSDLLYTYYQGTSEERVVFALLAQIVLLVGTIQIVASFLNVKKALQFVSRPVELGYFGGITFAIIVAQLPFFTGVTLPLEDVPMLLRAGSFVAALGTVQWTILAIGVVSMAFLFLCRKFWKNGPVALFVVVGGSIFAYFLGKMEGVSPIALLGSLGLPQEPIPSWQFPWLEWKMLSRIFPSAVAIAFLGILEVATISRTFGTKMGQRVNLQQEILGLGMGNMVLSCIGSGMASSGSSTRTLLNYRLQAKTRFAAVGSSLFSAAILLFCWPLVQYVPMASLAALLIGSVPALLDWKEVALIFRATREDAIVFLCTFLSCLFFTLDMAFFIGIVLSIGSFLRKSSIPHLVEYAFNAKGRLMTVSPKKDMHCKVRIIGIGGELYFAAAEVFQTALSSIAEDPYVQAIVLRLNNVYHMDASMCLAILHLFETLHASGRHLVISGLTEEVWQVMHRAGLVKRLGCDNCYFADESNPQFSTWKAVLHAHDLVTGENSSF